MLTQFEIWSLTVVVTYVRTSIYFRLLASFSCLFHTLSTHLIIASRKTCGEPDNGFSEDIRRSYF